MSKNTRSTHWFDTVKNWLKIVIIKSCLSKLSPNYMFWVAITAIIVFDQKPDLPTFRMKICPSLQNQLHQINGLAEYARLQPGMSLVEVESILGRGIEIERSKTTATFKWNNHDGSSITAVFEDDILVKKEQLNLGV
ncbi:MAG: hypothetical protein AB4206_21055 [Xenococcaceae cyanobacterium]